MKPKPINIRQTRSPRSGRPRALALLLALCAPGVAAYAATISGHVYDADNDIYLESAAIRLAGSDRIVYSERGGYFRLADLEPGRYQLIAAPMGYPNSTQTIIIENEYDDVVANFVITREASFELEAFAVEAQAIGQAKSLSTRRAAASLTEVISADAVGQFADRNPAEALQRVAGVTVEDDQGEGAFLLVRGASADLSNIEIDGVALATPQEDGRRVNLNVITNDQLERIELSKTWLPYQRPVIGGTVNLITRSALDRGKRFASIEGAATYREIRDDEISYRGALTIGEIIDGNDFDWLGDKAIGLQFSVNTSEDFMGSDTIDWGYDNEVSFPHTTGPEEEVPYGRVMNSTMLRDFDITRERLGLSSRLEFKWNDNHEVYFSISHNEFDDIETENRFRSRAYTNDSHDWGGTYTLSQEVVEELGLDPDAPHVAARLANSGPLTYNEAIALGELGYDAEHMLFTNSWWRLEGYRMFSDTVRKDEISTYQYGGEHRLIDGLGLDWKLYESDASQDSEEWELLFSNSRVAAVGETLAGPDYVNPRLAPVVEDGDEDGNPDRHNADLFGLVEGSGANRRHYVYDSTDTRSGYEINLDYERGFGELSLHTRAGIAVDEREKSYHRDYNASRLPENGLDGSQWEDGDRLRLSDELFNGGEHEDFEDNFGPFFTFGPTFNRATTLDFVREPEAYGVTFTQDANLVNDNFIEQVLYNYDATEDIDGYYLQQEIQWRHWSLIIGARYEETQNSFTNLGIVTRPTDRYVYDGVILPAFISPSIWRQMRNRGYADAFADTVVTTKEYDHFLPAVHLRRRMGENTDLRMSVTKTIGRPTFTDLIPREIVNIDSGNFGRTITLPAFDLEAIEAINYDISLDHYFEPIGLFSIGLFHKEVSGAIYDETRIGVIGDETAIYDEKYDSRGRALPWNITRKRNAGDGHLSGVELTFDRKFVRLPGAFDGLGINSNIAWMDSEATLGTESREGEKVKLFGQPSMTANVSLYYNKHGIFARLSYNHRGEYLSEIGTNEQIEGTIGSSALDTWVAPRDRLDFTLRYELTAHLQVFFDAVNLTNEPLVHYLNNDETTPLKKQYTERLFTVGLKWNL